MRVYGQVASHSTAKLTTGQGIGIFTPYLFAEVAESADALRSGRSGSNLMRVQIPPSAFGKLVWGAYDSESYLARVGGSNPPLPIDNIDERCYNGGQTMVGLT